MIETPRDAAMLALLDTYLAIEHGEIQMTPDEAEAVVLALHTLADPERGNDDEL